MKPDGLPEIPVSHALIDATGRLIAADPAIEALNDAAGGTIGAPLAVPPLATIVRLARRLDILVSRRVTVADGESDLELWVRAQPEGDETRLAISGWREVRPAASPTASTVGAPIDAELRWDVDAALRLTFVSIDAARRWGIDAIALLGQPLTALFAFSDEMMPILDAIARQRPFEEQRAVVRGTDRHVIVDAIVRQDAGGAFAGMVGGAQTADTEPAARAPGDAPTAAFTQGLDKALRAPLARIIANADTINAAPDGPVGDGYTGYAADIANAGRHLLGLVDDLVDLQGIERDGFSLDVEPIDLADIARRAAGLLAVRAGNAEVAIAKPLEDMRVPAHGDFRRVLQILVNLIGNAIRYSPAGSVVMIAAGVAHGQAFATVSDQGKGIAVEDQARIFEKFERIDPSEPGGNGLGLYIARRLASAMAGDLVVESAPDEGARFTLTLPADPARDQDQHQP
ncbi:sensor histidine kinase [Sphingomonas oligophenolica]|uniref:histidine kinase n=1 Tax=Sphingomonas oligophenolica TaxID=301154 RepID=A0A502CKP5_9SPHN|nr:HAMP domain-containing sensor histidine kinase [Sphingomonas oligophenolica]TPG12689.1 sensor histidine kinase [Sphingomonas oligophenolica]